MKTVKIGVCGLGTVGAGTLSVMQRNAASIARRAGCDIIISHVVSRRPRPDLSLNSCIRVSQDALALVKDPDLDIIVELIGGCDVALDLVMQAIEQGKHVVTANKALIATHGHEIFEAAKNQGVMVAFEAAVAGGIPIIKAIGEGLVANDIQWLAGIINGTCNFILTEMQEKSRAFADVLQEAQALGYAEADPTFDVEGIDAAHKLTILAALAFGMPLQFKQVYTEGITQLTRKDVQYADELGYCIKHLGFCRKTPRGIEMRVHPTLIPKEQLLANVNGVLNAVLVAGDAVGPTLYCGAGAGGEQTASSVIADVVDVSRKLAQPQSLLPLNIPANEALSMLSINDIETAYYLRITVKDEVGQLAEITHMMGQHRINIEAIIQKEPQEEASAATVILLTHRTNEAQINQVIAAIEKLETVTDSVVRIRVEQLES